MDIIVIFTTGLFAGGLTCLAVQGGLLASSIAQSSYQKTSAGGRGLVVPTVSFLIARLCAYTVFGLLLGLLGSAVEISLQTRTLLQGMVAIFMIGTALNLLHVHPIFRYFVIQPPKFLTRLVKNQTKNKSIFGPALLGAFTVFIPCGATQAMMAYALATGSPFSGALTMFVFILGTSPLFFALGFVAEKLSDTARHYFDRVVAVALLVIAMFTIGGLLALSGSSLNTSNLFSREIQEKKNDTPVVDHATIYFSQTGYATQPTPVTVKAGAKITLTLVNKTGVGCVQAFTIPKLNIQRIVSVGSSAKVVFIAPKERGPLVFTCSMGMYSGKIDVI